MWIIFCQPLLLLLYAQVTHFVGSQKNKNNKDNKHLSNQIHTQNPEVKMHMLLLGLGNTLRWFYTYVYYNVYTYVRGLYIYRSNMYGCYPRVKRYFYFFEKKKIRIFCNKRKLKKWMRIMTCDLLWLTKKEVKTCFCLVSVKKRLPQKNVTNVGWSSLVNMHPPQTCFRILWLCVDLSHLLSEKF